MSWCLCSKNGSIKTLSFIVEGRVVLIKTANRFHMMFQFFELNPQRTFHSFSRLRPFSHISVMRLIRRSSFLRWYYDSYRIFLLYALFSDSRPQVHSLVVLSYLSFFSNYISFSIYNSVCIYSMLFICNQEFYFWSVRNDLIKFSFPAVSFHC